MAAKVRRKLDNGIRRLREADRCLKRPASKYSFRAAGQVRRPARRVAAKVLTLHPAIVQLVKQQHCAGTRWWPPFCAAVDWLVAVVLAIEIIAGAGFHH